MLSLISITLAAVALVASVHADYYVNPDSVPKSTRTAWCASELSTCPLICQQQTPPTTLVNTCDPDALTYGCVCGGGQAPNISEYTLTLPYYTCTEWGTQCVKACGSDNQCSSECRENHPCGALNPQRASTSTSSGGVASATASDTSSTQVFGSFSTASAGGNNPGASLAAPALEVGRSWGLAVVLGGVGMGFALFM